jgi:C_GCAxxG_C_C family probable redox protein
LQADNKEGDTTMAEKPSPDYPALKARVLKLANGPDDRAAVEARLKKLSSEGIPRKQIIRGEMIANKQVILHRVQKRAEEYEQVDQNCAKSPALAVMEEFGFGDIKIITALSSLPGVALTGETCGAVLGGLVALSTYFGNDDLLDYSANARSYAQSRKFIYLFEKELGATKCRHIHKDVIFGQYHNVADPQEGYPAFVRDKGFEKCALPSGVSARICAEVIIQDMERKKQ